MKVYISGKITGCENPKEKFDEAAERIRAKGYEPINPCGLWHVLNPETTAWDQFMIASFGLLRCCDAILLLPDWEESRGARLERMEAARLRLKIYENVEDLPHFTH